MVYAMNKTPMLRMKRSKSSHPILISKSSQTLTRHRSFILDEKESKSKHMLQSDVKLEKIYTEAEESFEQGEYENALMKFGIGSKMDPKNKSFISGMRKSKNAIMNDLNNSGDVLKQLQDEINKYPQTKLIKDNQAFFPPEEKITPMIKQDKLDDDYEDLTKVKSETMRAAVTKVKEKQVEPTYNLTIHDGTCYRTITATAWDVKEYLKDTNYFKPREKTKKDWKKLRSEFNKRVAEKEAVQRYEREAKMLEEKTNIRHYCEEQVNLIGRYYQNGKMPDVIRFSENFIKYLHKKSDKTLPRKWIYLATAFNYLARAHAEQGDYDKAKTFGEKLYRIAITSNNTELIAQSYILSGKIYVKFEKYKEAAFVWEKLVPLMEEDEKRAWLFHEIGRCYFEMEKYDMSAKYGTESAHWAGKCSSSNWSCAANVLLGQVEMKKNNYEKASEKFAEAKKHAEISDDEQTINYINSVLKILNVVLSRSRVKSVDEKSASGSENESLTKEDK